MMQRKSRRQCQPLSPTQQCGIRNNDIIHHNAEMVHLNIRCNQDKHKSRPVADANTWMWTQMLKVKHKQGVNFLFFINTQHFYSKETEE